MRTQLADSFEFEYLGRYSGFFVNENLGAKLNAGVGRISTTVAGATYRDVGKSVDVEKNTIALKDDISLVESVFPR